MKLLVAILALGMVACTGGPPLRDYLLPEAGVELSATPFYPQATYQCGPAALAMVLGASGVTVSPETLRPYIYLPGRKGSLQEEIVAVTRRHGRIPYVLRPDLDDLLAEVGAGTPVLVMQNLGIRMLPRWHYAVVIGYDTRSDSLLLRSGTDRRLRMNRHRFEATWARAQNWAMVAAPPGEPPTTAQSVDWLRAASAFEELGQPKLAEQAYKAATRRWPEQALTWQVLANAHYSLGDLAAAEVELRRSLQLTPSAAAHNNLAHVLQKRGCLAEAAVEIRRAEAMADADDIAGVVARTRAAIEAYTSNHSAGCFFENP